MFSEIAEIALVAARLGHFLQFLKTRVILILNFTQPHAITHTNYNIMMGDLLKSSLELAGSPAALAMYLYERNCM